MLGRRDGLVSLASNVRRNIIDTGFSVDAMASSFTAKGLTLDDLVTLSGTQQTNTLLVSEFLLTRTPRPEHCARLDVVQGGTPSVRRTATRSGSGSRWRTGA
jgi:hypothetical protein